MLGASTDSAATTPSWPGAKTAIGIHRPSFLRVLEDAAKGLGASLHKGVTTKTTREDETGVDVTFTDGRQGRYDIVIGADGIGSATRNRLFPDGPKPAYAGQYSFRWMLSGPPVEGEG